MSEEVKVNTHADTSGIGAIRLAIGSHSQIWILPQES